MELRIKKAPTERFVCRRVNGPYSNLATAWPEFMGWAQEKGLFREGMKAITIYQKTCNDVESDEDLVTDIAFSVPDDFTDTDGHEITQLPQGDCAVGTHKGSYADLGDSWQKAWAAAKESGYADRCGAPGWELYVSNPNETPEEECLTDLYIPLS